MKLIEAEEITEKKNIMKNWDSRFEPLLEVIRPTNLVTPRKASI